MDLEDLYFEEYPIYQESESGSFDALGFVAIAFSIFLIFMVFIDRAQSKAQPVQVEASVMSVVDQETIRAPYDEDFVITQGPHGKSYGHLAIDLAAGEATLIVSPINGEVTELYVDQYGNPTLVLENDNYKVTMMHGKYIVSVGDILTIGQPVGSESNKGYTTDMQGRSCRNRDCGYHTHLNIYDKRLNANVNPLDLLGLR